jgi:hypothetical protein
VGHEDGEPECFEDGQYYFSAGSTNSRIPAISTRTSTTTSISKPVQLHNTAAKY